MCSLWLRVSYSVMKTDPFEKRSLIENKENLVGRFVPIFLADRPAPKSSKRAGGPGEPETVPFLIRCLIENE